MHLAEVQAEAGTVAYAAVLSLRSQAAATEASIPTLEQKIAQSNDLLATLTGHAPAEWIAPRVELTELTLPADLPVSLPSELLRQRPDIQAAEATAHAASAQVGVATAAMLPSIELTAGLSRGTNDASNLFPAAGKGWSLGANATAPLFQGGTLWFRRRAAVAGYQVSADLYRQTVLIAFAQVADALQGLDHDAQFLSAEEEALGAAQQALQILQANYEAGLSNYLELLTADAQFHQAQIGRIEAMALRYQDTVGLFAALGGGWWSPAPANVASSAP